MSVRNNLNSLNASRLYKSNKTFLSKHFERVSSGLRINRASDDAAGLAISEKMRSMIRGLDRSVDNCIDGISFIQVGEGALNEVHSILDRMKELSIQSSNGVYLDELDREALQSEFSSLSKEIDSIAKSTNFNTLPLFHYTTIDDVKLQGNNIQSLKSLLTNTKEEDFNIIFTEITGKFVTNQSTEGNATVNTWDSTNVKNILQQQIVPNVVQNILSAYPAFNYLSSSSIGIGLNLYSDSSTNTLAYVKGGCGGTSAKYDYQTYQLAVNMAKVDLSTSSGREELEHTISHEMIHAFMDEATTSGMFGINPSGQSVQSFPKWFIEGMAQTASGPGNWVKSTTGLGINSSTTLSNITSKLKGNNALTNSSNTTVQYGTGYLACMYLGYLANGGTGNITATSISNGLSKILAEVIDGDSLNDTLNSLTGYSNISDFESKFATDGAQFVHDLIVATGTGAGGVVSGDLTATDLIADTTLTNVKLFELNTSNDTVKNIYPSSVNVISGGTANSSGSKPVTSYDPSTIPSVGTEYNFGDFIVTLTSSSTNGLSYDSTTGELTINADGNYTIKMNPSVSSTTNRIKIADNANVSLKLDGININNTSANAIDIGKNSNVSINFINQNSLNGVNGLNLDSGAEIKFGGSGKLNITGTNGIYGGDCVTFESGNISISGTNKDIDSSSVVIKGGSINADANKITQLPTTDGTKKAYLCDLSEFKNSTNIKSVTADGRIFSTSPDSGGLYLWLEGKTQTVATTDASGVVKTYNLKFDTTTEKFSIVHDYPNDLFTVTGTGTVDSTAYEFDEDTGILTIKKAGDYTISGGTKLNDSGKTVVGRIVVDSNITGKVSINLDTVKIDQSSNSGKAAFEIGENTNVDLTLSNTNILKSGRHKAGLQIDSNVNLTIDGTGSLDAEGGYYGAGIGIGYESISNNKNGGNITIKSGDITAKGGYGAAGIGGCYSRDFGDITINGGNIKTSNEGHGAGIGGGWGSNSDNGKITITGGTIDASGVEHGTGIGAGCSGHSDIITITGGTIKAQGGHEGSGIGASWNGYCKDIIISGGDITAIGGNLGAGIGAGESSHSGKINISGGTINASGGQYGAGIGAGERSHNGEIIITGGEIIAQGGTNGTGIGGGRYATGEAITITGGTITAMGGLSADGGNIGSYTDSSHINPAKVEIGSVSIKAGTAGEGLYNTSGSKDNDGERIYSYPLSLKIDPSDPTAVVNIKSIKSKGQVSGYENTWPANIKHIAPDNDSAYIWMRGENQHITIEYTDSSGNLQTKELDIIFYPDSGMFRLEGETAPPIPEKPNNPSEPDVPTPPEPTPPQPTPPQPTPPQPTPPEPTPPEPTPPEPTPPEPSQPTYVDYILIKSGARAECISIPRFYFSLKALKLDEIDISTQENAMNSIAYIDASIESVSLMRGQYGAISNRLEHAISNNMNSSENLSAAESRIRDANIAKEIMEVSKLNILTQSAQAMIAQSNTNAELVLQLLN